MLSRKFRVEPALAVLFLAWCIPALATIAQAGEPASPYRVLSTDAAQIHQLTELAVSKDGSLVAVGTLHGAVQVWDWRRATMVSSRKIDEQIVENLFFMDDDKRLTVLYSPDIGEQHMYVWEMATGAVADEDKVQGTGTGYFMPDGTIGMEHGVGFAFMDQQGKYANRYVEFDESMAHPAMSPDGQLIAGGGYQLHYEELVIRDAQGKFLKAIDTGFQPYDTVFSPDSKTVAVMQQEDGGLLNPADFNPKTNVYELFDVATGKKLQRFEGHHKLYLSGAQFSPDGSRFLTWSGDGTLVLWDVKTGEMHPPFHRSSGFGWGWQVSWRRLADRLRKLGRQHQNLVGRRRARDRFDACAGRSNRAALIHRRPARRPLFRGRPETSGNHQSEGRRRRPGADQGGAPDAQAAGHGDFGGIAAG